jgi:hypothetical protein
MHANLGALEPASSLWGASAYSGAGGRRSRHGGGGRGCHLGVRRSLRRNATFRGNEGHEITKVGWGSTQISDGVASFVAAGVEEWQ